MRIAEALRDEFIGQLVFIGSSIGLTHGRGELAAEATEGDLGQWRLCAGTRRDVTDFDRFFHHVCPDGDR
jgi:hypothetical protein